jgi:hypothetical protein
MSFISKDTIGVYASPSAAPSDQLAHEIPGRGAPLTRMSSSGTQLGVADRAGTNHTRVATRLHNSTGRHNSGRTLGTNGETSPFMNIPLNTDTAVWILVAIAIIFLLRQ